MNASKKVRVTESKTAFVFVEAYATIIKRQKTIMFFCAGRLYDVLVYSFSIYNIYSPSTGRQKQEVSSKALVFTKMVHIFENVEKKSLILVDVALQHNHWFTRLGPLFCFCDAVLLRTRAFNRSVVVGYSDDATQVDDVIDRCSHVITRHGFGRHSVDSHRRTAPGDGPASGAPDKRNQFRRGDSSRSTLPPSLPQRAVIRQTPDSHQVPCVFNNVDLVVPRSPSDGSMLEVGRRSEV